jgi:hypothetical protein
LFGDEKNPEFPLNPQEGLLKLHYQWVVGKVGLDSDAGWLANVDGFTGYLFVQSFDFVPVTLTIRPWRYGPMESEQSMRGVVKSA